MWQNRLHNLLIALALAAISSSTAASAQHRILSVKDTAYSIAPGALFVAPSGNDGNGGSKDRPLRTVSAAITAAPEGGVIVIRQGTYREALPGLSKRLTLQPYPHEQVWLKGSRIISGWTAEGNAWRKDNWTTDFCGACFHPGNIDPAHPYAGLPEQVFIDGEPLKQVASQSALTDGTFYVDGAAKRLYIGSDPLGRAVEASVHGAALNIWKGAEGTVVRGLGFAHYSPVAQPGLGGMVKGDTDNLVFQDNSFAWSAVKGLVIFGKNAIVRGNSFVYNGMMGLGAWRADGMIVKDNSFAFNNQEGFARSGTVSEAAGAKLTVSRNLSITDNLFEDNQATGLWLDINVTNAVIARNIFRGNRGHGVYYEISSNGIIASNIAAQNRISGIALSNASHMQVVNNTLAGNAIGLLVQNDDRVNDDPQEVNLGNTWIAGNTSFINNLIAGAATSKEADIWVRDFSAERNAGEMLTASNFNGFYRNKASQSRPLVEWWRGNKVAHYTSLDAYRSATGRDRDSIMLDEGAGDPFFTDAASGTFALKQGSVARNRGEDLSKELADAIGVAAARSPDLGALLLPGGAVVTPR